jgi:hypothetical protein
MRLFPILLFFLLPAPILAQEAEWTLRYDKDDIQVHHRKSEFSSINELKLVTTVPTSMPVLLQFLSDVDHFPIWVYRCVEAREVERMSRAEGVYYSRMDFPWPLRDRDFFARSRARVEQGGKVVIIEVEGEPDYEAERHQVVRIPMLKVTWTLTELAPEKIRVEYYLHTDPGGNLPNWMINMAIDKGPSETMQNIRSRLVSYHRQQAGQAHMRASSSQ